MSDISIPGVSSKYNTDKTIKALMEVERIPLIRMENDRDTFKEQKNAWLRLNTRMSELKDSSKKLYGFENPFNDKIAASSDQSSLTATASRSAIEEEKQILINRIAAADRFISKSLSRDYTAPKGLYRFKVGDKEVKFNFRGGSLRELADAINRKTGDILKASLVDDTKETKVIVIEAKKTGADNRLSFHDQALSFGEQAGIVERSPEAVLVVSLSVSSLKPWEIPLSEDSFALTEGVLTLNPRSELKIPLSRPVTITENMALELEISTTIIPEEEIEIKLKPEGPTIPDVGGIEFKGIRVQSARSKVELPELEPPEPPERISDMKILFASDRGRVHSLPEVKDSEKFYTLHFDADELPERIDSLNFRNRNTHRIIHIKNIKIFDKTARGDYRPVNPLSTAHDAVIIMDGIEVVRSSNSIDDLIPGVNLTLHSSSEDPVNLSIKRNIDSIKDSLIRFIGYYNQLHTRINILTRRDESIIEDAKFLNEDEKERAHSELGLFQGNLTLNQLKSRLQRIMMNPYPTRGKRDLSLLAHIGIATNAGRIRGGAAPDKSTLLGYLQINEEKLDEALLRHADWVKDLFGYDTDKDLVVDSGAAYAIDTYLNSYVGTGGIVSNRVDNLNNSISGKNRKIDAYNKHLDDYERELKKKFGIMEGALDTLEKSSQAIENFNRQYNR